MLLSETQGLHLMPILQLVVRQVQLHDMSTEGSNLSLVS